MSDENQTNTCGIIMPISHTDDDHTEAHWADVLGFVIRAIEGAGMTAQPVWKNADYDIIQAKILKNIFENEIVICDVSTRNPNVMLELGMRLTTKRPTIVIAEIGTKLPFDTSIINTEFYDPSLKFSAITKFVIDLSTLLEETAKRIIAGTYHTFLEAFTFETVRPSSVSVSEGEAIAGRLEEMVAAMARLDRRVDSLQASGTSLSPAQIDNLIATWPAGRPYDELTDRVRASRRSSAKQEYSIGNTVFHDKYGLGTVVDVEGTKLDIEFGGEIGRKRVIDSFVRPF